MLAQYSFPVLAAEELHPFGSMPRWYGHALPTWPLELTAPLPAPPLLLPLLPPPRYPPSPLQPPPAPPFEVPPALKALQRHGHESPYEASKPTHCSVSPTPRCRCARGSGMPSSNSAAVVRGVRQRRKGPLCTKAHEQRCSPCDLGFSHSDSLLFYASDEPAGAEAVGAIEAGSFPRTRKARRHLPCV